MAARTSKLNASGRNAATIGRRFLRCRREFKIIPNPKRGRNGYTGFERALKSSCCMGVLEFGAFYRILVRVVIVILTRSKTSTQLEN